MKTTTKTTGKQDTAANAVRNYMRNKYLSIESDENSDEGVPTLTTSKRDSAGDDEPTKEIIDAMRAHAKALRELSPLVYVSSEVIDEWVHLTIRVKREPRKDRPEEVKNLVKTVLERMPEAIRDHPKARFIGQEYSRHCCGAISVLTEVMGPYGKRSVLFGWDLRGDTSQGWTLLVQWGTHSIKRPAKFKKLTPAIVLEQFGKLLAKLRDPLDAMGWTIHVNQPHGYVMTSGGRKRETYDLYQVTDRDKKYVTFPCRAACVEFTNNLSGHVVKVATGSPLPEEVRDIAIEE